MLYPWRLRRLYYTRSGKSMCPYSPLCPVKKGRIHRFAQICAETGDLRLAAGSVSFAVAVQFHPSAFILRPCLPPAFLTRMHTACPSQPRPAGRSRNKDRSRTRARHGQAGRAPLCGQSLRIYCRRLSVRVVARWSVSAWPSRARLVNDAPRGGHPPVKRAPILRRGAVTDRTSVGAGCHYGGAGDGAPIPRL